MVDNKDLIERIEKLEKQVTYLMNERQIDQQTGEWKN